MAGPIKISVLADVGQAVKEVTHFSDVVDSETKRVVTSLGDSKMTGGFGKIQEGFDVADTRAMGFRDTITGVQDTMTGLQGLLGQSADKTKTFGDHLLMLGMGVGDLASGFANFLVPMAAVATSMNAFSLASARAAVSTVAQKVALVASTVATGAMTAAQWLLNAALSANPIGIVILAIVALVAAIVIAYKNSATFRAIVETTWRAIQAVVQAVVSWFTANLPKLWVVAQTVWNLIRTQAEVVWRAIQAVVNTVVNLITAYINAYRAVAVGAWNLIRSSASTAWNAIVGVIQGVVNKVSGFMTSLRSKITSAFSGAATLLVGVGRDIVSGLVSGISGAWGWVTSKINSLVSAIPGPVRKLLGIGSPSKVFAEIGMWTGRGLAEGIEGQEAAVRRATESLVSIPAQTAAQLGTSSVDVSGISAAARQQPVVISFEPSGDPLMDAIFEQLRKRIRINGGDVQSVLGRA